MRLAMPVPAGVVRERPSLTTEQCAAMFSLFAAMSESEQQRIYAFLVWQKARKK